MIATKRRMLPTAIPALTPVVIPLWAVGADDGEGGGEVGDTLDPRCVGEAVTMLLEVELASEASKLPIAVSVASQATKMAGAKIIFASDNTELDTTLNPLPAVCWS